MRTISSAKIIITALPIPSLAKCCTSLGASPTSLQLKGMGINASPPLDRVKHPRVGVSGDTLGINPVMVTWAGVTIRQPTVTPLCARRRKGYCTVQRAKKWWLTGGVTVPIPSRAQGATDGWRIVTLAHRMG